MLLPEIIVLTLRADSSFEKHAFFIYQNNSRVISQIAHIFRRIGPRQSQTLNLNES